MDKETLLNVASTARLRLSEEEIKEFLSDLSSILDAFSVINKVNTDNVKPTLRPVEVKNIMREDKVKESINRLVVMRNVKNKEKEYYKGPRVY